jgi:hypothetical protein
MERGKGVTLNSLGVTPPFPAPLTIANLWPNNAMTTFPFCLPLGNFLHKNKKETMINEKHTLLNLVGRDCGTDNTGAGEVSMAESGNFLLCQGRAGVWVFHPLSKLSISKLFTLTNTSRFENWIVGCSRCILCYGVEGARPEVRMQLACGGWRGVRDPDHLWGESQTKPMSHT